MNTSQTGVAIASLVLTVLSACSESGGEAPVVGNFNDEVFGHTSWATLSPMLEKSNLPTGNMQTGLEEIVGDQEYSCSTTEYSMTDSPSEFISMQPDSSILWLGNMIQGDSHLNVGALAELSIDERAPLNISVDLLFGDNTRTVDNPSLTSVNSAIGSLIASAVENGIEGPVDSNYEEREAHSTYQTALERGFTAEYLGSSAEANLEVNKQGAEKSFFAYFIQKAFTFSMELPTSPQDMVSSQFSETALEDLRNREQIGSDNPPLYISSITYGKILIYKMTASYESERIAAAIKASYEGISGSGSGYSEAELQEALATSKIEITAVGGNQGSIEGLIRTGQLASYFNADTDLNQYRPISFELRNLKDNSIAGISRTTEYNVKECAYVGPTTEPVGEQAKITLNSVYIPAYCDDGDDAGDVFGYFNVISHNPATNADYSRPIYNRARTNDLAVKSGNSLAINESYTINQYYGTTFQLSGILTDKDEFPNGADDTIGMWNGNRTSISGKAPGTYKATAIDNCSGKQPQLTYTLERLKRLF